MGSDALSVWWILFQRHLLPLKHWNPSNHRCHMPKDWNYDLKIQWQSVCKCILAYKLETPPYWATLASLKVYPLTGHVSSIQQMEYNLYHQHFESCDCENRSSLVSPTICWSWRWFILLLRSLWNGIWNFYLMKSLQPRKLKSLMQCGTAITWEVEVWCPPE
jgi:hypothetical protein